MELVVYLGFVFLTSHHCNLSIGAFRIIESHRNWSTMSLKTDDSRSNGDEVMLMVRSIWYRCKYMHWFHFCMMLLLCESYPLILVTSSIWVRLERQLVIDKCSRSTFYSAHMDDATITWTLYHYKFVQYYILVVLASTCLFNDHKKQAVYVLGLFDIIEWVRWSYRSYMLR